MRSLGHATRKSNSNLRGKKTMDAGCGCCTWRNLKEDYWRMIAKREMRDYL